MYPANYSASGTVISIARQILLKSPQTCADLKDPFPKQPNPDKLTTKNQVSLLFQNRDLLTATFIDLSASGVKIEHPLFGPKELPVESIRVIDFHKRRDGTTSHPSLRPLKKVEKIRSEVTRNGVLKTQCHCL